MALYNFIDVNKVSEGVALPSEALKINGEFIENQITGYRTLSVSGREALSPEIDTFSTGVRNGSTLNYKRYPERIITVKYQLIAKTNKAFRDAYNKLGSILNCVDAELIFNDELDKFFIGTPSTIKDVEPGSNSVIGEFEILCTDPFKYSTTEYEVTPTVDDGTTFIVDYKGTHKAFPTFEVDFFEESETGNNTLTGKGDCGFVAFFNEDEKIIQIGDPDEKNTESYAKSQTLINQIFKYTNSWGSAAKALWSVNGIADSSGYNRTGSIGLKQAYKDAPNGEYYLTATDYGSGSQFHGPSILRTIPADAAGDVGAKNFTLHYSQKLAIGASKDAVNQIGYFNSGIWDSNGKALAGIIIHKTASGKTGTLMLFVNNKEVYSQSIDLSLNNKYFGNNSPSKGIITNKTTTITKSGGTFTFNVGGIKKTFYDSTVANAAATEVFFEFMKYGNYAPLEYHGIYGVKFTKNNCDTWRDIPNKFSANDVVNIDCSKGDVFLNGLLTPALGALGNDWEEFFLKPGVNQIGVSYSDWVTAAYAPTFKMRYREVFL